MALRIRKIKFEKVWGNFREKITNLLELQEFMVKGMDLFTDVYDLCTAQPVPFTAKLYDSLQLFFTEYVDVKREVILSSNDTLQVYAVVWDKFRSGVRYINVLCKYLNDLHYNQGRDNNLKQGTIFDVKPTVEAMALAIWKKNVVAEIATRYSDRLLYQACLQLLSHRNGEPSAPSLVSQYCSSLVTLDEFSKEGAKDAYKTYFESQVLAQTREYYAREAAEKISQYDMSSFMKHVQKRLEEEEDRGRLFMDSQSFQKLIGEVEAQFITAYPDIFHAECGKMIRQEMLQDFGRMYELLARVPEGVKPLLKILEDYIVEVGLAELDKLGQNASKNPQDYFDVLLAIHAKYMGIVSSSFKNDAVFSASVDKAFRVITNDTKQNPDAKGAELLARCCDIFLRKNAKSAFSESDLDEKLNQTIVLFKYVDDKDVFQKFYSRMLAKRLIYDNSVSDDAESNMISRLKTACGFEYTSKLQRMFTDISVSKDLNEQFVESLQNRNKQLGLDFSVLVLTAGAWPIAQAAATTFNIPPELERCIPAFQEFYNSRHSGRKLTWLYHLSRGDLRLTYLPKRYELQLTVYQTAVLLLFNTADRLPFAEIYQQTQLNEAELIRVLKSLVEVKVINASSVTKDAVYELNMGFSSKRMKMKISGPMQSETQTEKQETHQQIDVDRQLYLQALVVRIMKTRKRLHHNQLVENIIKEAKSRFAPSIGSIKKCIEGLIEKAYIERDNKSRDEYLYVA